MVNERVVFMYRRNQKSTTEFFAVLLLLLWLDRIVSLFLSVSRCILKIWLESNRNKRALNCQTKLYSRAFY